VKILDNINFQSDLGQTPKQLSLWETPGLNIVPRLKTSMREAFKLSGMSKEQVVSDMNDMAIAEGLITTSQKQRITIPMLEKWVAPSALAHVISFQNLVIFCKVIKNGSPFQVAAIALGLEIIGPEDKKLLQWARAETKQKRLAKEARKLAQEVGI
jgi:hypothetical protein